MFETKETLTHLAKNPYTPSYVLNGIVEGVSVHRSNPKLIAALISNPALSKKALWKLSKILHKQNDFDNILGLAAHPNISEALSLTLLEKHPRTALVFATRSKFLSVLVKLSDSAYVTPANLYSSNHQITVKQMLILEEKYSRNVKVKDLNQEFIKTPRYTLHKFVTMDKDEFFLYNGQNLLDKAQADPVVWKQVLVEYLREFGYEDYENLETFPVSWLEELVETLR